MITTEKLGFVVNCKHITLYRFLVFLKAFFFSINLLKRKIGLFMSERLQLHNNCHKSCWFEITVIFFAVQIVSYVLSDNLLLKLSPRFYMWPVVKIATWPNNYFKRRISRNSKFISCREILIKVRNHFVKKKTSHSKLDSLLRFMKLKHAWTHFSVGKSLSHEILKEFFFLDSPRFFRFLF